LTLAPVLAAQTAPAADSGSAPTQPRLSEDEQPLPAYHHSIFSWEHTVTAATLGVGDKPQSYNPTYSMGLVARTRYYFIDDTPAGKHLSVRLDTGLYREFTNNDQTTQRGELNMSDTDTSLVWAQRFRGPRDTNGTIFELRPLTLTLPTSKVSYESGRYFGAGVTVGVTHVTPWLQGKVAPEIASTVRLAVGYKRWFARATVPTNPSLERVRLTPDGRSLPGDTLSGSSLVRDQLDLSARLRLQLGKNVLWTADASFGPSWKYDVQDEVQLCGVVLTGCTTVQTSANDSRYLVRTQFSTEISVRIATGFSVDVGYGNTANQLGADGRRRSIFYSPDAVFYASLSFFPHELATSSKQLAQSASPPQL
jgi:hypothetical protein